MAAGRARRVAGTELRLQKATRRQQDWREEAFQREFAGDGASGQKWTPVEATPVEKWRRHRALEYRRWRINRSDHCPFAGDAWARRLATTVQEKVVETVEPGRKFPPLPTRSDCDRTCTQYGSRRTGELASVTDTRGNWKRRRHRCLRLLGIRRLFGAAKRKDAEQFLQEEPGAAVPEAAGAVVNEFVEQTSFMELRNSARSSKQPSEGSARRCIAESVETKNAEDSYELAALDFSAPEAETESAYASSAPAARDEPQEVPAYREPETDFVAHAETPAAADGPAYVAKGGSARRTVTTAQTQQLDMKAGGTCACENESDVLQRVTQEILKR